MLLIQLLVRFETFRNVSVLWKIGGLHAWQAKSYRGGSLVTMCQTVTDEVSGSNT